MPACRSPPGESQDDAAKRILVHPNPYRGLPRHGPACHQGRPTSEPFLALAPGWVIANRGWDQTAIPGLGDQGCAAVGSRMRVTGVAVSPPLPRAVRSRRLKTGRQDRKAMAVGQATSPAARVSTPAGLVVGVPEGGRLVFGRGPDADLTVAAGWPTSAGPTRATPRVRGTGSGCPGWRTRASRRAAGSCGPGRPWSAPGPCWTR